MDGLGNALTDYEDPNVPSLLSIPLLGYPYNRTIYANTRARILSHENKFFYEGVVRNLEKMMLLVSPQSVSDHSRSARHASATHRESTYSCPLVMWLAPAHPDWRHSSRSIECCRNPLHPG